MCHATYVGMPEADLNPGFPRCAGKMDRPIEGFRVGYTYPLAPIA